MSPWTREAHHRKILSACAVTSLVLLVGLLMFFIIFVSLRWQTMTEEGLIQDPAQDSNDCTSKAGVITDEGIPQSWKSNKSFSQAWRDAERKARAPAHVYMERDHSVAIYLYTSVLQQSTGHRGEQQNEIFKSRLFYSLLSEALQVLRHSQVTCLSTTYRSNAPFSQNVSHGLVRFSTFILGSDWWNFSGNISCFEVFTCFGANVTLYSALTQSSQVLIPPYEVFRVSDVEPDAQKCKVLYKLKSNTNCVYDRESNTLHPISASSDGGFWLTFIITCVLIVLFLFLFVTVKLIQNSKKTAYNRAEC